MTCFKTKHELITQTDNEIPKVLNSKVSFLCGSEVGFQVEEKTGQVELSRGMPERACSSETKEPSIWLHTRIRS